MRVQWLFYAVQLKLYSAAKACRHKEYAIKLRFKKVG
jgi:hypothetical protein